MQGRGRVQPRWVALRGNFKGSLEERRSFTGKAGGSGKVGVGRGEWGESSLECSGPRSKKLRSHMGLSGQCDWRVGCDGGRVP